jgi:hypothetical protein
MYLEPLSGDDATRLVTSLTGTSVVPVDVVAAVAEASGGNPLFVEEVLRTWVQGGTLRPGPSGGWQFAGAVDRLEIPSTIRAVYLGQLDDLPDVPRRVVELGSVPGSTFPSRALPVLGVDEPDPALTFLTDSGLLTRPHPHVADPAAYTYRHALYVTPPTASCRARPGRSCTCASPHGWLRSCGHRCAPRSSASTSPPPTTWLPRWAGSSSTA